MPGAVINLPAVVIVLLITALLVVGIRESARFNAAMVAIKLAAVLFFIVAGVKFVKPENWSPFAPYGWSGIMAAGAVVFFAYIGFDAVSTTAEEAKNPKRDLPIGIITSLVICTVLYIVVAGILSGIVPVTHYRTSEAGLPGIPIVPLAGEHGLPERPGGLRAPRHRPGLGGGAHLRRRGGRHHERPARHADGPAPHLLLDEPRPAAAGRVRQGAPPLRHALHHHDHHRARRRPRGRRSPPSTWWAR